MKTMYLTVRVDFSCPKGMDLETAQGLAESLAIQPNMISVVNGVTLNGVEVCGINEEEDKTMKEKVLTQEQWDLLANLVLAEMGNLREFCNGRPEAVRAALHTEIGALHTLYNYLIE